jgi:radical SAM superfamily enzyme YgiQ (UPF0313 family)
MAEKITVSYVISSESDTSLGLEVLFATLRERFDVVAQKFDPSRPSFEGVDALFVSFTWWEDIPRWIQLSERFGLRPGRGHPPIIFGGTAVNPVLLRGLYDYAVLGDGETVIIPLMESLISGGNPSDIPGVVSADNFDTARMYRTAPILPAYIHTEIRRSAIPRIEIARGCKWKCPFCQVAHLKPYRELPTEIVKALIKQVKGRSVGLFAPDRCDHSGFIELQRFMAKQGKRDSSRDARFDSLVKFDNIDSGLTIGLEGLTAAARKFNRKAGSHEDVLGYFDHLFNRVTNKKGAPVASVEIYVILDFPPDRGLEPYDEFNRLLRDIDSMCHRSFTLFISGNSFSAKPFSRMAREGITLFPEDKEKFNSIHVPSGGGMKNAKHGGCKSPVNRVFQAACDRGDGSLFPFVRNMSLAGWKFFTSWDRNVVRAVLKEIRKCGWNPEDVYGPTEKPLWFEDYQIERVNK